MNERALSNALAFAEWDFPVFSVWATRDGACLCPKGKDCTSPGKHPIPRDGLKAGSTDPDAVTKMLRAPGSGGQYGVGPRENTIYIDADGEGWAQRVAELGLGGTFTVITTNGCHLYFYWPPEYGPQPTRLFGWVVRSLEHPGYVIGPGSTHVSGKTYRIHKQNGHDIHEMLASVATFPREYVPQQGELKLVVSEGVKLPETILEGSRHDFLRDRARTLRGGGLTGDDLFNAVSALNRRLPQPKSDEEVRRAIGDVETKFGEDPVPLTSVEKLAAVTPGTLIVNVKDYVAALPTSIEWVSPLCAYGFVSLVAGPPKAGKSTLISNLLWAREHHEEYLWGTKVATGPSLLVTEESGLAVGRKVEGLTELDILDRRAFTVAGLTKLDDLLAAIVAWCEGKDPAVIVIDTLAIWGDIKDENDAMAATRAVGAMSLLAQVTGAAVILIHHARKGGGEHGEGIRGSGAIFATVDHAIELNFSSTRMSDERKLDLSGRLIYPASHDLTFDRATNTYMVSNVPHVDENHLDQFPVDGASEGLKRADAEKLWGCGESTANRRLKELVADGRLIRQMVRSAGDKTDHGEYFRPRPLLDVRSVSERMADVFAAAGEEDPDVTH